MTDYNNTKNTSRNVMFLFKITSLWDDLNSETVSVNNHTFRIDEYSKILAKGFNKL